MVKQEIMLNEYENNREDNVGSSNSRVKSRKIVQIKRTARLQRQGKNKARDTNDGLKAATDVLTRTFSFDEDDNENNDDRCQFVRLVWIQKRKAADENGEDQDFSRYRNKRKRVKLDNDDHVNRHKRVIGVAGCAFKPDYDLTISWL